MNPPVDRSTSPPPALDQMHDVASVARQLCVCSKTIRRAIKDGHLPAHRFGRMIRISASDYAAFVAARRTGPNARAEQGTAEGQDPGSPTADWAGGGSGNDTAGGKLDNSNSSRSRRSNGTCPVGDRLTSLGGHEGPGWGVFPAQTQ